MSGLLAAAPLEGEAGRLADAACASLRRERMEELAVAVTSIPSATGEEGPLAAWLASELAAAGLEARTQPLDDTSANAIGRLRGSGGGGRVLLYAPIDTATTGRPEEDVPWIGPALRDHEQPVATVDAPLVRGLGASNPKGHAACVVAAVEALAATGATLPGDIIAGFGAGGMPTNGTRRTGRRTVGQGAGCSYLLEQGTWPDAAIIAKPGWTVSWEEVGLAWVEVTVHGTHTYVGSTHRIPYRSAVTDTAAVIEALDAWAPTWTARRTTGTCAPQVVISSLEGGWPHMPAFTPAACRLRLDVRLPPGTDPGDALGEIDGALAGLADRGVRAEAELVLAIPGTRTDPSAPVVRATTAAWEAVAGEAHQPVLGNSGATDANILRSRGIPTARVGMPKVAGPDGGLDFQAGMNTVDTREMLRLSAVLIRAAVALASTPREAVR